MKKLFFDIQITGHHSEYVNHLIDYLSINENNDKYYFVVHPDFTSKFSSITNKTVSSKNIIWLPVTNKEYVDCFNKSTIRNSFSSYRLMNKYAIKYQVDQVCLLYFNIFQIATIFYRPSYTITGILFLQFYRMSKNNFSEKLKYYRKYYTTKFYTLNPSIKKVFVLNDTKTVVFLNKEFNTTIFKMLPDPIAKLLPLENFDIFKHYNIESNCKIFLHIGSLGNRKGTLEIIEAANFIASNKQKDVFILLVGKAENKSTERLMNEKISLIKEATNVRITWDNQFVSYEMMKSLFDQSDVILLPYKNTEASSGILGHAAAANKKVIATGKGLIKEMIEENNLGVLLDNVTPYEIASTMEDMLNVQVLLNSGNNFVLEHSPSKFAEFIMDKNN